MKLKDLDKKSVKKIEQELYNYIDPDIPKKKQFLNLYKVILKEFLILHREVSPNIKEINSVQRLIADFVRRGGELNLEMTRKVIDKAQKLFPGSDKKRSYEFLNRYVENLGIPRERWIESIYKYAPIGTAETYSEEELIEKQIKEDHPPTPIFDASMFGFDIEERELTREEQIKERVKNDLGQGELSASHLGSYLKDRDDPILSQVSVVYFSDIAPNRLPSMYFFVDVDRESEAKKISNSLKNKLKLLKHFKSYESRPQDKWWIIGYKYGYIVLDPPRPSSQVDIIYAKAERMKGLAAKAREDFKQKLVEAWG